MKKIISSIYLTIYFAFLIGLTSCDNFDRFLGNLKRENPLDPKYDGLKGIISGTINNLSGEFKHECPIQVVIRDYRYPDFPFNLSLTSNNGTFISQVPPGNYKVIITENIYGINIQNIGNININSNEMKEIELKLPMVKLLPSNYSGEIGILSGKVTYVGGLEVAGAEISAGSWLNITDSNGNYSMNLPVGIYEITAREIQNGNIVSTSINNINININQTTIANLALPLLQ